MYLRPASRFAKIVTGSLRMSNRRLIGLAARLCCLGVSTVFLAGAGCGSGGSSGSSGSSGPGGSSAPSAEPSTEKPGGLSGAAALSRGSGGGAGGGASEPSLPLQFSGNGSESSVAFLVNTGTVTVYYTYNCSSAGDSGDFAADMISGPPSSPTDDQSIANLNRVGESDGWISTTVNPQAVGSSYYFRSAPDAAGA